MGKKLRIEKGKQRSKWRLLSLDEGILDAELLTGAHIEIFGNSKITIDGCLGVFEYKDTYIKLRLSKGMLILCGSDFDVVGFEERVITVKGKISSLEFCV